MATERPPFEERFERPAVMGVLNVTPDSFSDGGRFLRPRDAIDHARRLVSEGAAIVDIGAESTRPGAEPVSADEELARVVPVLEAIGGIPVSIDTSKAAVASRAVELGAEMVNDVTALRGDPALAEVVAEHDVYLCLMHMQGEPRTMQAAPRYDDVVSEVVAFLEERLEHAVARGIREDRICLDPGIGFGKAVEQNLELVRRLDALVALGRPVLVGFSRKSSLGRILGDPTATVGTMPASLGAAVAAFEHGASMLRVHDVLETVVFGHHGYLEEERRLGQRFLVDLWVDVEESATASDRIEDTVDYRRLAGLVREVFAGPERLLLEGLAGAIADGILGRFAAVERVRVRVRKPDVVLDPPVEHAAVIVERLRT
ncbi:MAG: dihydropteroate synthase [Actinobacteria bacterium]|nr:MAG: dihydropteroate synthase [Actinomycetota bacterium]